MLSGVSLLAVSNVNNPVGLVGLPCVMWSAHFFVTHIQTEKISSWNCPTVHVCCFMLARASTKTFVSRVKKQRKFFVSRKIRWQGHSLAEESLYLVSGNYTEISANTYDIISNVIGVNWKSILQKETYRYQTENIMLPITPHVSRHSLSL